MSESLLFVILAGIAEILVLYLFVRHGIKEGLVHELGNIISMAAAFACLLLVLRIYHNFSDAKYDKVAVGIAILAAMAVVFSICRFFFFAIRMTAKLPVIRIVDRILGSVGGLAEGLIVLYVVETVSSYFIKIRLNLVSEGLPAAVEMIMRYINL